MPNALDLTRRHDEPGDDLEVTCPNCHEDLKLHQPDRWKPDLLLGTCRCCSSWFLIDTVAEIMIRLREEHLLQTEPAIPIGRARRRH